MEEQKSAARKDAQNCKEEEDNFRAAAAEDLSRCEQQLREKSERCRNLELELKQALSPKKCLRPLWVFLTAATFRGHCLVANKCLLGCSSPVASCKVGA